MPGALSSLKIVEVGEMVSAPYATNLMADLGPELINIEQPSHGDRRAQELTFWGAGGICAITGGGIDHPERPPLKAHGMQSGFQGGVHAAVATMGAVMATMRDGEGQEIDVAIQEALAAQLELF